MATPAYRVTVEKKDPKADIIAVLASGVDREEVRAWEVHNKLTARFVRAIKAGVVISWNGIKTDSGGKTYWATESKVLARMLNAELVRLGY